MVDAGGAQFGIELDVAAHVSDRAITRTDSKPTVECPAKTRAQRAEQVPAVADFELRRHDRALAVVEA